MNKFADPDLPKLADPALQARRESASQIDEFFEEAVDGMPILGQRFYAAATSDVSGLNELRDWDDIKTSLSQLDPENADMLELGAGVKSAVKVEPCDDCSPITPAS